MTLSERIGILLFLHTRNELSEEEKTELSAWRRETPENEQLFREVADPDFMRRTLREYYQERGDTFQTLKQRFPYLANAKLSNEQGFEDFDEADQQYREFFPEKQLAEAGLSKLEFWKSMIPELELSSEAKENEEGELGASIRKPVKSSSFKKNRNLFISILAAASLVLGIIYYFDGFNFGENIYSASMESPDGSRFILGEMKGGFKAGSAGIRFEQGENGETVWLFGNESKRKKTERYSLETGRGKEFVLKLPDGTRVLMNAETTISFPANFTQDTIILNLEGEAFFELADHSPHHYMIRSDLKGQGIMIQDGALKRESAGFKNNGPQLNISSYPNTTGVQATLIGGPANIRNQTSMQEISLLPGQQVNLNNGRMELNPAADPEQVIAWKNGNFDFRDLPIQQIMPDLERWYDLSVSYPGRIPDKKFTLQVPRNTKLSKVLAILEKQGLIVRKSGRELTITF